MKKHHILESLFLSFYSKSLYQDVAKEWKGLALGYLLLVMAICWLPFSYDFHQFLNQYSSQILPDVVKQIPIITIAKGKLSIDKPEPYIVKQPGDGVTLIVFDTSGRYTSLDQVNTLVLATQDKVMVRDNIGSTSKVTIYSLAKFKDTVISKADIAYVADRIVFWSSVLMYPISVIVAFVYRLLEALILGGAGVLFAHLIHVKLTYQTTARLAVVALTPILILSTLIEYFSLPVPQLTLIGSLLAIGYLGYAIQAQKEIEMNQSTTTAA